MASRGTGDFRSSGELKCAAEDQPDISGSGPPGRMAVVMGAVVGVATPARPPPAVIRVSCHSARRSCSCSVSSDSGARRAGRPDLTTEDCCSVPPLASPPAKPARSTHQFCTLRTLASTTVGGSSGAVYCLGSSLTPNWNRARVTRAARFIARTHPFGSSAKSPSLLSELS